jgi:hypothetical protein
VLHKHHERGLKSVIDLVRIRQNPATNTPDHRPVTLDKSGERLVGSVSAPIAESVQQLAIGQAALGPRLEQRVNLSQHIGTVA